MEFARLSDAHLQVLLTGPSAWSAFLCLHPAGHSSIPFCRTPGKAVGCEQQSGCVWASVAGLALPTYWAGVASTLLSTKPLLSSGLAGWGSQQQIHPWLNSCWDEQLMDYHTAAWHTCCCIWVGQPVVFCRVAQGRRLFDWVLWPAVLVASGSTHFSACCQPLQAASPD